MTLPPHHQQSRPGFTIIELLVVVSIIALIMALLLPALGASRRDAQLIQSISNLKQIGVGTAAHASDNKGDLPIDSVAGGLATWSFGGKFCDPYWAGRSNGIFDIAPNSRPLNPYLTSGSIHPPVTGRIGNEGLTRPANASERTPVELEIFKSPRDTASVQRKPFGTPVEGVSAYDDTGTNTSTTSAGTSRCATFRGSIFASRSNARRNDGVPRPASRPTALFFTTTS